MVKTVELREKFSVDVPTFWRLFWQTGAFKETFHKRKGDSGNAPTSEIHTHNGLNSDIVVTEWLDGTATPQRSDKQRMCFFTMIENEGKDGTLFCTFDTQHARIRKHQHSRITAHAPLNT